MSASGKKPRVSWEKMSKSKFNGVDPHVCETSIFINLSLVIFIYFKNNINIRKCMIMKLSESKFNGVYPHVSVFIFNYIFPNPKK